MLSDQTIRKINTQIQTELRTVGSFVSSPQQKSEALERITQLKALLTTQPSRQEILAELAAALKEDTRPAPRNSSDIIVDLIESFRR